MASPSKLIHHMKQYGQKQQKGRKGKNGRLMGGSTVSEGERLVDFGRKLGIQSKVSTNCLAALMGNSGGSVGMLGVEQISTQ